MGRRGRQSNKKKIVFLVVLGVVLALIAAAAITVFAVYSNLQKDVNGDPSKTDLVTIEIVSGDSTKRIASKLEEKGIIDFPFWFVLMARQQSIDNKLQIGTYEFSVGDSYQEILNILKKAPNFRPSVRISFAEGTEVTDIIDKFLSVGAENNTAWTREGFNAALKADYDCPYIPKVDSLPKDVPTYARLEGFLYPDTYDFFLDMTEEELFAKMIDQFNRKAESVGLVAKAQAAEMTVYEALVLGSIIQRESGNVADFPLISSVFNNRLDIDMKLQSDAAVNYMIPKAERRPGCTTEQLNTDTPYNIYMHKGLTPTPICCARIEAAVAACEPQESDYYYFIGTPDGVTIFAKTYAEHLANVNKYLR